MRAVVPLLSSAHCCHRPGSWAGVGALGSEIHRQLVTQQRPTLAQRDKVSAIARPPRCGDLVNSAKRAQKAIAPSAFGHDLRMTLGTTPASPVRSRVVAQLERWGCPILYSPAVYLDVRKNPTAETSRRQFSGSKCFGFSPNNFGKILKNPPGIY